MPLLPPIFIILEKIQLAYRILYSPIVIYSLSITHFMASLIIITLKLTTFLKSLFPGVSIEKDLYIAANHII